jgi:uncharacterized metal-binding protein
MDLKSGVLASALERTLCDQAQLQSKARSRFKHRSSQPMSHAIALVGPMIPLLPALCRGNYLRSIAGCTIECMHQCYRTHGLRSNIAL